MSWFESPQYLKSIQKIRAMPPEDKAVTKTLVDELSGLYAGADMQKQLQAMRFATQKKSREDELRVQYQKTTLIYQESCGVGDKRLRKKNSTTGKTLQTWPKIWVGRISVYPDCLDIRA
jgi:hypothetical protein